MGTPGNPAGGGVFPAMESPGLGSISSAATVDERAGDILFATTAGTLYAVSATGHEKWNKGLGSGGIVAAPVASTMDVREGSRIEFYRVVYVAGADGEVRLVKELLH